ncbi:hypothetical protein CAEBREN_16155 [Caenorhabditis brenneri]|uniref:Putative rRNA methyltransferase n=1 Tax=Caenorhabditis brenneri TaxID=135651 RepID=G0MWR9_CAEBE|nr:hypothetical protein CAEBREN_16155 [Caenorhabditis brenneri]
MGKKVKIGKQRRDKYYKLAKEAGYRSRAAFKLVQLNKRFEFLEKSRATVDLCAAPGGWMQVASQFMPVSSLIVGVDLAPIKPIKNCIALQGDITTNETRAAIKKELKTWSADCVLHDGAPNVGLNWVHDAFQQNCLTLSALKLATQILRKGGTFVTKVFRSNDYSCLIRVFEKLFKRVHVWKPAASRLESAEIFVVCEVYQKPDKVGPEYLDPKKVFANPDGSEGTKPNPQNLLIGKQKKAKAEGYDTDSLVVHATVKATDFIKSSAYLDILGSASVITLDDDKWKNHEKTTDEVKEYMNDVKVLGPRELRVLLRWRKSMLETIEAERKAAEGEAQEVEIEEDLSEEQLEDRAMAEIDELIAKASEDEKAALKKKKKKMLKAKARVLKRRELKMIIDGDEGPQAEDQEVFQLKKIRKAKELAAITKDTEAPNFDMNEAAEDSDEEGLGEGEWETMEQEGGEDSDEDENELIHTANSGLSKKEKKNARTESWFEKEEIAGLISDEDDDDEMNAIEKHMGKDKKKKYENTVSFEDDKKKKKKGKNDDDDGFNTMDGEEQASDSESDAEMDDVAKEKMSRFDAQIDLDDDEEERYEDEGSRATKRKADKKIIGEDLKPVAKKRRLTPEQLALGEQMIYSSKSARDLEDNAWNRYANNDEGLPDWFVDDEKKHYFKTPPVTKEQVALYRERMREFNARPSKKVAEAKARKQRKMQRKLESAKKKAEGILENDQMEHSEKVREMKKVYANATRKEKKKVEVIRMTKGKKGKTGRPAGQYKLVDSRMKKDLRAAKAKEKTKGRGKGRGGPKKTGGRAGGGRGGRR